MFMVIEQALCNQHIADTNQNVRDWKMFLLLHLPDNEMVFVLMLHFLPLANTLGHANSPYWE